MSLPSSPSRARRAMLDAVDSQSGAAFDSVWATSQIAGHREARAATVKQVSSGSDATFVKLATSARPVIQQHLTSATNVAFYRNGFPANDAHLAQGADEVDLQRRLRRWGRVVWDADNVVNTSSRRLDRGLAYTLVVSFGYYYALGGALNRLTARSVVAPPVRPEPVDR